MINLNEFVNLIDNLSILELNELIKALEVKYNCESLPINIEGVDKTNEDNNREIDKKYSLILSEIGVNKISVIKVIREINNLSLKESKDLVESAPVLIKENIDISTAEEIKRKLENCGSLVILK